MFNLKSRFLHQSLPIILGIIFFFSFSLVPKDVQAVLGVDWTILPAGTDTGIKFGTAAAYSVAYGGDKFVVVGASGKASYSSDGITWTGA